jgi:hypothetical protein
MRGWSTSHWLLWGCLAAIALWILITVKLSSRVSQNEFQGMLDISNNITFLYSEQSNRDMKLFRQLEDALSEIKLLRAENNAMRSNNRTVLNNGPDDRSVLRRPSNRANLYSKEHEVEKRALDNSIRELFFYLFDQTRKNSKNPEFQAFGDRAINQVG